MRIPSFTLRQRGTLARYAGAGSHGDTFGVVEPLRCRLEPSSRVVLMSSGQTARAEALMLTRPEIVAIPVESLVVVDGTSYRVLSGGPIPDARRPTHHEYLIG